MRFYKTCLGDISPTFTIVNEYKTTKFLFFTLMFIVYLMCLSFYEIGGEEYFENGICLIEWGELISDALPSDFIHITFWKKTLKMKIYVF